MRARRAIRIALVGLIAWVGWTAMARAADPPTSPVLKLQFAETSVRFDPQPKGGYGADVDILVENDGLAASTPKIAAYASLSGKVTPATSAALLPGSPTDIVAFDVTALKARVVFESADVDKLTIVLTVGRPAGVPPAVASLSLTHGLPTDSYEWALGAAAGLSILIMIGHLLWFRRQDLPRTSVVEPRKYRAVFRGTIFPPTSDWTFSGNWTTSASALGAVLGTVLASTGVLTDIVPGLDTGRLLGTSILLGALLLMLPLIYAAGAKQVAVRSSVDNSQVSVAGVAPPAVLLCAFLSMFVTLAELGLVGALVNEASLASEAWLTGVLKVAIIGLLAFAALCLAAYALRTLNSLRGQLPAPPVTAATPKRAQLRLL